MNNRLLHILNANDFVVNQYDFREKQSTSMALLELVHDISSVSGYSK